MTAPDEPCVCGTEFPHDCLAGEHVNRAAEECHHCGQGPDPDGDHSCPCPHPDETCPNHHYRRSQP